MNSAQAEWTLDISPMNASMEYLITSLQNPYHPTSCIKTLVFCLVHFLDIENTSDDECYGYHNFWSTLYQFLVAERTDEQFNTLIQRLSTCSCEEKDDVHGIHAIVSSHKGSEKDSKSDGSNGKASRDFVVSSLRLICTGIKDASGVDVAKGISKRWPTGISDLIPHGSDAVVQSLLQWNAYLEDDTVLMLITTLVSSCGNLIHDSLIKYNTTDALLLEPTRKRLLHTIQLLESGFSLSAAKCAEFHAHSDCFFRYITRICTQATKAIALMNGGETKAVELCSIICYIVPHLRARSNPEVYEQMEEFISGIGRLLYATFYMHLPGRPAIPLHPLIVEKGPDAIITRGEPEERIASAMTTGRFNYPCSSFYCNLYFTNVGNKYKKCSRCLLVGYCSQECQTQDWKDEPHSHKRICRILCKIKDERGGWRAPLVYGEEEDGPVINEERALALELAGIIVEMLKEEMLSRDEFEYLLEWSDRVNDAKTLPVGKSRPDLVWNPGYDDYDQILKRFMKSRRLKGLSPNPQYINRDVNTEE